MTKQQRETIKLINEALNRVFENPLMAEILEGVDNLPKNHLTENK